MMLIDTHVHLQNAAYADDLHAVLERAASAGVRAAVLPGSTLAEARAAGGGVARQPAVAVERRIEPAGRQQRAVLKPFDRQPA